MSAEWCPIEISASPGARRHNEPITIGVPFPKGMTRDGAVRVTDQRGIDVPVQKRVVDQWSDGSARWVLLDCQIDCREGGATYNVSRPVGPPEGPRSDLIVAENSDVVAIDTGTCQFVIARAHHFPFSDVRTSTGSPIDCRRTRFIVEDERGGVHNPRITRIVAEERGPLRACVRIEGDLRSGAFPGPIEFLARLHFFRGSSAVRFVVTLRNPSAMTHPGGFWELGSAGAAYLRDTSLVIGLARGTDEPRIRCSPEAGRPFEASSVPLELYQDSSGGTEWASHNHLNRSGVVPNKFRGYRLRRAESETFGHRATPVVAVDWDTHHIAATLRDFWQNCPKALEVTSDAVTVRLFPRQYADLHELQGGEQRTHVIHVAFGPDTVGDEPMDWCRAPAFACLQPQWCCASGAVPHLVPEGEDPHADYLTLIHSAIEGEHAFAKKREIIDEYGWRHFGDLYADHEATRQTGGPPLVSHYNNQYDPIASFVIHLMRTGDRRWADLARDLADHVADIDIYHTQGDKSAYNGGMFWHTAHYVDAVKSTHRSYPRVPGVWGGGPSAEHNYSTGLMLQHFLTGDQRYRDAVIGLAEWVLAMDDGNTTVFRWLSRGYTGLATATASPDYHGPGRAAAYSITTLLNAHQLTRDCRYVLAAEKLIRRCIHPTDDVAGCDLLNAELRWSYTVFLQVLGRYLDYKVELNELDAMYAYAQASLLHYARWMADHERPYLDRREQLEFPDDTWVAQDVRKADVFRAAALHAPGAERARFVERSEFFFRYSTSTLRMAPSGALTRPIVIMLGNGYAQAWLRKNPDAAAPPPRVTHTELGPPTLFVPQKARAKKRVVIMAACALVATVAMIGMLLSAR